MLNHIKLTEQDALKRTELLDLGRINVICGKNNSGKSTLLLSIADDGKRIPGVAISRKQFSEMGLEHVPGHNHLYQRPDLSLTRLGRQLLSVFESMPEKTWFEDEKGDFMQSFHNLHQSDDLLKRNPFATGRLATHFDRLFQDSKLKAVLIPPKRNIQTTANIQRTAVQTNGDGLINYLFFAKNQEHESRERKHFELIEQVFKDISSGFGFTLVPDNQNVIRLRFRNPNGISADAGNCELGLQDLLVLLYFTTDNENSLVLIEEPESHLHPEMQRKLLGFFAKLEAKQIFLATHSNIFLDSTFVDKVFYTKIEEKITVRDETNRAMVLSDLGYQVTDNLVSDLIVLVEGPTDVPVYEHFLAELDVIPKYLIKFWPLGGDIMSQLDLSVFSERYKIIAIVDRDPKSGKIREQFRKKCDAAKVPVHQLARYAIENYFPLPAIRHVFKGQVPEALAEIAPDVRVEDQLGFNIKNNNRKLVRATTLDDIAATDLFQILMTVKNMCEATD